MGDKKVLHLLTQPHGSTAVNRRRACEVCGLFVWLKRPVPAFTDDAAYYDQAPEEYVRCRDVETQTRLKNVI